MHGVHKLGFSAQKTKKILPETVFDTRENVFGEDEPSKLGMEYVQIIPVLVKAIQEQQVMIEELKAEIAAIAKQ